MSLGLVAVCAAGCARSTIPGPPSCGEPAPYVHLWNTGALYRGTHDGEAWSWTHLSDVDCVRDVSTLAVDGTGRVWLGTAEGSLAWVDVDGGCELAPFVVGDGDTAHTSIAFVPGAAGERLFAVQQRAFPAAYRLVSLDPESGTTRVIGPESVEGTAFSLAGTSAGELFLFHDRADAEWRLSRLDPETGDEIEGWPVGGLSGSVSSLVRYQDAWVGAGFLRHGLGGNLQLWKLDLASGRLDAYGQPPEPIGGDVAVGTATCPQTGG